MAASRTIAVKIELVKGTFRTVRVTLGGDDLINDPSPNGEAYEAERTLTGPTEKLAWAVIADAGAKYKLSVQISTDDVRTVPKDKPDRGSVDV